MRRSESIKALAKALVLAKQKMEAPHKNKQNPHFKNNYADLAAVKASYQLALGENGLGVVHAVALTDGHLLLTTSVIHAESGEWIASDYPIPAGLKPQETGSAVSYGRRYNVCALLDIVAEDDDDGEAAQAGAAKQQAAEKAKPAPEPKPVSKPAEAKPPVVSREEIEALHSLAKTKGLTTVTEFRAYLKGLTNLEKASELSRDEYAAVMDSLKAMREKVPA